MNSLILVLLVAVIHLISVANQNLDHLKPFTSARPLINVNELNVEY